jgi:PAS domain S-box-containing protein
MVNNPDPDTPEQLQREVAELRARVAELDRLQQHDAQVQLIAESIPVPIVITRVSDTTILAANTQVSELFGWPPDSVIGRLARDFFYSPHEFRQLVLQVHRDGAVRDHQARGVKADGTVFWLAASIKRITFRGEEALVSGFFDLTERFQSEAALRQSAAELQTRNDELDAFAHTVAHDLKSPLSLIMGYAEILSEIEAALPDAEARLDYLHIIGQTSSKINNIIEELMLLAEVRKGRVDLQPLNMRQIALESQSRLGYLIEEQQVEVRLAGDWPLALGYRPWVEEVWINYLSNAIKYGGRPPRVELGADMIPIDGQVRFWVRDNGQGLTPAQQAQLFTPFTQLAQVRATGHGLGLSIVRRIIEKLGGTVGVESTIGQGSTFYFRLPTFELYE